MLALLPRRHRRGTVRTVRGHGVAAGRGADRVRRAATETSSPRSTSSGSEPEHQLGAARVYPWSRRIRGAEHLRGAAHRGQRSSACWWRALPSVATTPTDPPERRRRPRRRRRRPDGGRPPRGHRPRRRPPWPSAPSSRARTCGVGCSAGTRADGPWWTWTRERCSTPPSPSRTRTRRGRWTGGVTTMRAGQVEYHDLRVSRGRPRAGDPRTRPTMVVSAVEPDQVWLLEGIYDGPSADRWPRPPRGHHRTRSSARSSIPAVRLHGRRRPTDCCSSGVGASTWPNESRRAPGGDRRAGRGGRVLDPRVRLR